MRSDKETKRWFKGVASAHPDEHYATAVLQREGFLRKHCACGTWFWTVHPAQTHCGDPSCSGGFRLFTDNPCEEPLTYTQVWQRFSEMLSGKGYKVMPRYPVVARWNPTMDFTIASIAAFQPHVVNGEAEPPAQKLVIPQFCLRFGDIDNVGITGSHMTGFVMIGQHMFVPPEEWDQNRAFEDLYAWFTDGLGLPREELTLHEDAWAGGGNYGPCMEFFSRGVELANQVYMLYEQTPSGDKELSLKVLDMGMGMERNAWFSQGEGTAYDATFPLVIGRILARTGLQPNRALQRKFLPLAAYLNIDEVEQIDLAWERVAREIGVPVSELRTAIEPMQAVYSIAEHARAILFALTDGALPSNVGGGYNLRTIFRRAQGFIDKHGWDLDMGEVAAWHAEELQELFPELSAHIAESRKILAVELQKHVENRRKSEVLIAKFAASLSADSDEQGFIDRLVELYDSNGVDPQEVVSALRKRGVTSLAVPENFYKLVAERHERQEQKTATRRETHFPVDECPKTKALYFQDYSLVEFDGTVVKVIDPRHVVLDATAFYPTSGGQEHDTGVLLDASGMGSRVVDVIKQAGVIIHVLEEDAELSPGDRVRGKVDWLRRQQLAQHHTATHIINGAARRVLGDHVWQAGAAKTLEKGRIDITHYENLTDAQLAAIEAEANRIVNARVDLSHGVVPKGEAEAAHGFRLYQGGAVPGREIRVVDIPGFDVEACGGTHLNNTGEAVGIKILRSSKIQDGIIRIEYVAGAQAQKHVGERAELVARLRELLGVEEALFPAAAEALFQQWKAVRKGKPWTQPALVAFEGDALARTADVLKTQPGALVQTIERFKRDIAG